MMGEQSGDPVPLSMKDIEEAQRESRAAEQQVQYIRAKLVRAEQTGFVTPDRGAILAEFKARKPS